MGVYALFTTLLLTSLKPIQHFFQASVMLYGKVSRAAKGHTASRFFR
jgi:hypothetical protein